MVRVYADLDRRVEEVEALQEERPLLGEEDGEALVDGDLRRRRPPPARSRD